MTAGEIKSIAFDLGADLCGIAPVDRFSSAPKGFHPIDIYEKPDAKRNPSIFIHL